MEQARVLKRYFGHDDFRRGQKPLVDAILAGRDVLGVMPTGAGKSVCYQLPALLLEGMTVVVSPLISLMKDQVAALTAMGIPAACINSMLTPGEYADTFEQAGQGRYRILYVAPERLLTSDFQQLTRRIRLPLVAVDEAHCVSQWGQDFRPSYLDIAGFIEGLPARPVVGAFTATATEAVRADIVKLLGLRDPLSVATGFDRPNLFFDVQSPRDRFGWVLDYVRKHKTQAGIVYCGTRKAVDQTWEKLVANGVSATRYHAGLEDEARRRNQEDFVYDRRRVMVATNAFGMGIDKSNIGFVLHLNMPKNLESYYQEAGRAGRDGEPAQCVLLFAASDVQLARFLIDHSSDNEALSEEDRRRVRAQDLARLRSMTDYCKTSRCYRAALLRYFGESAPERCDNCGNCLDGRAPVDITVEAQKILSCVARVERQRPGGVGAALIGKILRGSRDRRIGQMGLDALPTFGIMKDTDRAELREDIDALVEQGYLLQTQGEFPVLRLTDRAWPVLRGSEKVVCARRQQAEAAPSRKRGRGRRAAVPEDGLYESLRMLRSNLAQAEGVPAYVVFSNATLADMVEKRPANPGQLLEVSGVGEYKAARYGRAFLEAIREWEMREGE